MSHTLRLANLHFQRDRISTVINCGISVIIKRVKHMLGTNCSAPLCKYLTDSDVELHDICVKPVRQVNAIIIFIHFSIFSVFY